MNGEGFGRNIRAIFGVDSEYAGMGEKPIASVEKNADGTRLKFTFKDGTTALFDAEGDCCSHSWIEHLTVPDDVDGAVLEAVEDALIERTDGHPDYDCLQVYRTNFKTNRGDIIVEYRNASNGYYGGYLTRVEA